MTEVALLTQVNQAIIRREGKVGIENTEAIRIIPATWNEANAFLIHRTTKRQVLRPRADEIYVVFPLTDHICFLHMIDRSTESLFSHDVVTCVCARAASTPGKYLEIITRHNKRGMKWEKITEV
ncbi:MAG: hypothetical protein WC246_02175 [Candidatus Paceibacterota bacterium]|jgi:hypothetical protein